MRGFELLFVDATCVTTTDAGWGWDGSLHVEQLCLLQESKLGGTYMVRDRHPLSAMLHQ